MRKAAGKHLFGRLQSDVVCFAILHKVAVHCMLEHMYVEAVILRPSQCGVSSMSANAHIYKVQIRKRKQIVCDSGEHPTSAM